MKQGRFRWKAMLLFVVGFVVVGIGWYFLHKAQMRSIHLAFLEQAERAEESGNYDRTVRFLREYLMVDRDNVDIEARYAMLLEDKALQPAGTVLKVYLSVLGHDEKRQDIRKRYVKLASKAAVRPERLTEHLKDVLTHIEVLRDQGVEDADLLIIEGNCLWAQKELDQAEKKFELAIKTAPHNLDGYVRLAQLLQIPERNTEKNEEMNQRRRVPEVLDRMVSANPQQASAYRIRAAFRQAGSPEPAAAAVARAWGLLVTPTGPRRLAAAAALLASPIYEDKKTRATFRKNSDLIGAGRDLTQARKLAPDDAEVLLVSASQEMLLAVVNRRLNADDPHVEEARAYLRRAEQLHPKDTRVLTQVLALEMAANKKNNALDALRGALGKASGSRRGSLQWDLAKLLLDEGMLTEAKDVIEQMRKGGEPSYKLDYLRGRMAFKQGKWHEAAEYLEAALPALVGKQDLAMEANLLLAECYGSLGNTNHQLVIYQRAFNINVFDPRPRVGIVQSLINLGRWDDAVAECKNLKDMKEKREGRAGNEILSLYSRALILRKINQPGRGSWDEVAGILKTLQAENPSAIEAEMLRAEMEIAQGRFEVGREILLAAKEKSSESFAPWIALAAVAARQEHLEEALAILDEASARFGDLPELRLARLSYAPSKKEEALAFLKPLAEGWEAWDRSVQGRLLAGLAMAYERAELFAEAENFWQRLTKQEPNQLGAQVGLLDMYFRMGNRTGMEKTLQAMAEIEGPDGPYTLYGKVQLLIHRSRQGEKGLIPEARRHLEAAAKKREGWTRIPETLAVLAEMEGNYELMVDNWRQALTQGSRQLTVIRGLVNKLMESRRYAEAEEVLRRYQESGPVMTTLQKMAAQVSVYTQNMDRVLDQTAKAVSDDSKDYKDQLWKGQMLLLGAMKKDKQTKNTLLRKAESAFVKATELAAEQPEPWLALIYFYGETRELDKAKVAMTRMQAKVPVSHLPLAMAQSYQALHDLALAEKTYVAALAAQPNNLFILQNVAQFYLAQNQMNKAEPYLRRVLDPGTHWVNFAAEEVKPSEELHIWGRHTLARSLLSQGTPEKQSEAMALVDQNLAKKGTATEDQILKALLLATSAEARPQAIKMLEAAFKTVQPSADQLHYLASLYEAEWDWPKARTHMQELLSAYAKDDRYAEFLATFIGMLLFHDELSGAEAWLPRLREISPGSNLTMDRQARWLAKRGNIREALAQVSSYLESKDSKPADAATRLSFAAQTLIDVARLNPDLIAIVLPQCDKLLRSYALKTGKKESMLAVALFLANCQKLEECLDLCEQRLKDLPVEQVVTVAVSALALHSAPSPKSIQRVEAWVKDGQQRKPDSFAWYSLMATIKERQGDYAEAEALYRKVLERDAQNVVANNNLAYLLALQGKGSEASVPMRKAMEATGRPGLNGELLDTRSVVYRAQGKFKEAEKDLERAIGQQKTATRYFHLAQIHQSADDSQKAYNAFDQAVRLGLSSQILHPLERESYQEMFRVYSQAKKGL